MTQILTRDDVERIIVEARAAGKVPDLSDAKLSGTKLSGTDLRDAMLAGAKLDEADLRFSNFTGANLTGAILIDARLAGTDLIGADLTGAHAIGASLYRADLRGAILRGADMTGADMTGADMTGANVTGTDMRETLLADTQLGGCEGIFMVQLPGVPPIAANWQGFVWVRGVFCETAAAAESAVRAVYKNDLDRLFWYNMALDMVRGWYDAYTRRTTKQETDNAE